MKVLIIGGTRFIGPMVVQELVDQGHDVTLFHRGKTHAETTDTVNEILGDRKRLHESAAALQALKPDVVIDMIPVVEQDARSVVDIMRGFAWRVVAISSIDVYKAYGYFIGTEGPLQSNPLTEEAPIRERLFPFRGETPRQPDDPQRHMDDYDKILIERVYLGEADLPGIILRLPMVYGPRDNQHRMHAYLKRMDDGRRQILFGQSYANWRWSRSYVGDIAHAVCLATTAPQAAGRIYNVAEEQALSMTEWVEAIARSTNWQGEIIVVPDALLPDSMRMRANLEQHIIADSTRIRRELGYAETIPRDDAYTRTIAWERANRAPSGHDTTEYAAEDEILARWSKH